ncbi:hypothetical protein SUGI_0373050 [Cryptomeria japonica]|nr:hypothetical protein SUGI_0373050 [Cryptomeria japonica]
MRRELKNGMDLQGHPQILHLLGAIILSLAALSAIVFSCVEKKKKKTRPSAWMKPSYDGGGSNDGGGGGGGGG